MFREEKSEQKCIRVAFAGLPNAGKSSLLNLLIDEKISIISPKAQTTRDILRGILVENDTQLIIIDTPGIFIPKKNRLLERKIIRNAWCGVEEADLVCIIIDSVVGVSDALKTTILDIIKKQKRIVFVLNKVDLIKKEKLLDLAEKLNLLYPNFDKIFMVSAVTGENVNKLKHYLISIAPQSPWLFNDDEISDAPLKYMASEITREKLFLNLYEDLPYSVDVITDNWEEFNNGDIKIQQTIRVLKESQKAIVVGKSGSMLKRINILARQEIEKLLNKKVHLFLFVKVKDNWISNKF